MKLIALILARNEAWTLAACVSAVLRWCDAAVILDHASTDATPTLIATLSERFPGRIHGLHEADPVWHEMAYRQRTLDAARRMGATHCAIVDADEMLTENLVGTMRDRIAALAPGEILQPAWLTLWRSMNRYRDDDSAFGTAFASVGFADGPDVRWQARSMPGADDYDFHQRAPIGAARLRHLPRNYGGLLHFQHANWRRLIAKQSLYKVTEMIRWPGIGIAAINARYDPTVDERGLLLSDLPAAWTPSELARVYIDAEPWQELEVRRLVAEYPGRFAGLNLYGVA